MHDLTTHVLGTKPFVLVQMKSINDDNDITLGVQFGGGITQEMLIPLLEQVIESLKDA